MHRTTLSIRTGTRRFSDLTADVAAFARDAGGDGLVHLFVPHATAGVAVFETGAGTEQDLSDTLDRLLPRDERWVHSHGSLGHGADHVLPAFIAPSLLVPVEAGRLMLGTWQSIVLVDPNADNPDRRIILTLIEG